MNERLKFQIEELEYFISFCNMFQWELFFFSDTNTIIGSTGGLFFFGELFWFSWICLDYLESQNYVDNVVYAKFKFAWLHGCKFLQPPKFYTRVATKHTEWNREPFWFLQSKKQSSQLKTGFLRFDMFINVYSNRTVSKSPQKNVWNTLYLH